MNINPYFPASSKKYLWGIAVVIFVSPLFLDTVSAQFGASLPQSDFTWTWGNRNNVGRGFGDISIRGDEAGFRCNLTGKLRVGTTMSRLDLREIESDIRGSRSFVRDASNAMNNLESRGQLDWGQLECKKPQPAQREQEEQEN